MMTRSIAGIDVHKRVLMVAVGVAPGAAAPESIGFQFRRFGTTSAELMHLAAWL
jgi:hypothetical protein